LLNLFRPTPDTKQFSVDTIIIIFQKEKRNFKHFYSEKSSKRAKFKVSFFFKKKSENFYTFKHFYNEKSSKRAKYKGLTLAK
jgi:hypothetical protein